MTAGRMHIDITLVLASEKVILSLACRDNTCISNLYLLQDLDKAAWAPSGPARGISELSGCLGPPSHQGAPQELGFLENIKLIKIGKYKFVKLHLKIPLRSPPSSALTTEIESLPNLPQAKMTAFELLTYLSQIDICELYQNLWIALRIACTLDVTVA